MAYARHELSQEDSLLQEWGPESKLLHQIPTRALKGFFSQSLDLTCIDATTEYIALGTNCGLIYWYNRTTGQLDKLRMENTACSTTCISIVSTVDNMLAAGTDSGIVAVFQIPRNDNAKSVKVERFTISGVHDQGVTITCLQWSQNGMKLFSGDKSGRVVLTSIDFHLNVTKSQILFNEQFEIVQISYNKQMLLVSTLHRTILCDGTNETWNFTQVGIKNRKVLGDFGGTFCKFDHGDILYLSRPGHRIWLADSKSGHVQQTLIFKEAVQSAKSAIIPILNKNLITRDRVNELAFGKLLQFSINKLIAYNSNTLFILNPSAISVVSWLNLNKIFDIAITSRGEIFVLADSRQLIRIADYPNPLAILDMPPYRTDFNDRPKSFNFDSFATKLKDTAVESLKRITSDFMITSHQAEKVSPASLADDESLPPLIGLLSKSETIPDLHIEEHHSVDFGNNQDDQVIARPVQRERKMNLNAIKPTSSSSVCVDDNTSKLENECASEESSSFSMLKDVILNDDEEKSIDTCESASENMPMSPERFLREQERVFSKLASSGHHQMVNSLTSDRTENMSISINMMTGSSSSSENLITNDDDEQLVVSADESVSMISVNNDEGAFSSENSEKVTDWNKEFILSKILGIDLSNPLKDLKKSSNDDEEAGLLSDDTLKSVNKYTDDNEEIPLPELEEPLQQEYNKEEEEEEDEEEEEETKISLKYGPPSGSSLLQMPSLEKTSMTTVVENDGGNISESIVGDDCWLELKTAVGTLQTPSNSAKATKGLSTLSVCGRYVVATHISEDVFASPLNGISLNWTHMEYRAKRVRVSPTSGRIVWVLDKMHNLIALVKPSRKGPYSETWMEVASNVRNFDIDDDCGYFVKHDGTIKYQGNLTMAPSGRTEDVPCAWFISDVASKNGILVALTESGEIIATIRNSSENIEDFRLIQLPSPKSTITSIHMDPRGFLWIVDERNNIYFSDNFLSDVNVHWWQILIAEYIFQNGPTFFENVHSRIMSKMQIKMKQSFVASNKNSIWVYNKFSSVVHVNKTVLTGYSWKEVLLTRAGTTLKLKQVSAEGVFEDKGHLWFLSIEGNLLYSSPNTHQSSYEIALRSVQLPETWEQPSIVEPSTSTVSADTSVQCISSSVSGHVWVLCGDGAVFQRIAVSDACPGGISWRPVPLPLRPSNNAPLSWISLGGTGANIVWALDQHGRVYCRVSDGDDEWSRWMEIDEDVDVHTRPHFVKLYAGPCEHMVWALDKQNLIYVREGIFPSLQMGTGWVKVQGTRASYLAISSSAVYAITPSSNTILRRHNISPNNYIGDYWKQLPGPAPNSSDEDQHLVHISASFNDELWAIVSSKDMGFRLLKLHVRKFRLKEDKGEKSNENKEMVDNDEWELVT